VRRRLVVSILALVMLTLVAFALPLAVAVERLLESRALDDLQGRVEQLGLVLDVASRDCGELQLRVAQLGAGPDTVTVLAPGSQVVVTTASDGVVPVGAELRDAAAGRVGRRVADGRVAVAAPLTTTVCAQALVLHASQSDAALRRSVASAWTALGVVALVVAAGAAATAGWLAGRLANPFEALTSAARALGEGDFSVRAPRSGLEEADRIAEALDGTAARLARALERSVAFTSDASHQLRTPLTALRLQLETLAAAGATSPTGEAAGAISPAVEAALAEADRLEATIEDLSVLTRVDAPEVAVELADFVSERLSGWRATAREWGRTIRTDLLPVPTVQARPAALAQAVTVLLDNACRHGRGTITVRVAPALPDDPAGAVRLCVVDEGRVAEIVDRPGGRGLPLARALVAAEGGRLTFAVTEEGTTACLVLGRRS
jgi:signal transduction histidine kinase